MKQNNGDDPAKNLDQIPYKHSECSEIDIACIDSGSSQSFSSSSSSKKPKKDVNEPELAEKPKRKVKFANHQQSEA